jgi:hypothetical protein
MCRDKDAWVAASFEDPASPITSVFQKHVQIRNFLSSFERRLYAFLCQVRVAMDKLRMSGNQFGDWFVVTRDDDGITGFSLGNSARQVGFKVLNGDLSHGQFYHDNYPDKWSDMIRCGISSERNVNTLLHRMLIQPANSCPNDTRSTQH